MNGALRGRLRPARIGSVLRNYRGDVLLMSFKDVGICGLNEEEVLSILEGLWLFSKRYVGALFFSFSHAPTKSLEPKRESAHIHGRQPTRKGKESTHGGKMWHTQGSNPGQSGENFHSLQLA